MTAAALAVAALFAFGFAPAQRPAAGTILVLVSARTPTTLSAPLEVAVEGAAGSGSRVTGTVPAAPAYRQLARVNARPGSYPGVRLGGVTVPQPVSVSAGQVTPVLVAVDASGPVAGGVYAGNDQFNLGLSELAGKLVPLPEFSLVDQDGRALNRDSLLGKPVVIAAFHTTCHETCPLYTGALLQLRRRAGDNVRIVEVTTDPVTDRPSVLTAYAREVGADWTFATGTPQQVEAFWEPFDVTLTSGDSHESVLIVADAHGYQRIAYRGAPDVGGQLPPALVTHLDAAGYQQLASHGTGWGAQSVADALAAIEGASAGRATTSGGGRAPVFTAPGLDGHRVLMDAYQGRPLVVNFFASWCHPCQQELPLLERYAERNPAVQFVLFDYLDDPGTATHLLQKAGVRTPVVALDQDAQYARAYGVFGLPTTVFVRPDGTIEGTVRAQLDESTLRGHLATISG